MDTMKKDNLLTQQQLEEVTGGKINWGNGQGRGTEKTLEAVRFAFYVGAEVETWHLFHTERGRIIARKVQHFPLEIGPHGTVTPPRYEPLYQVQYLKNGAINWFWQDALSY